MVTKERGAFPGVLFLWRGSALAAVWPILVLTFGISVGLTWAHHQYDLKWLELGIQPFTIVGVALSLFLGFRNQDCYQQEGPDDPVHQYLVGRDRVVDGHQLIEVTQQEPTIAENRYRKATLRKGLDARPFAIAGG